MHLCRPVRIAFLVLKPALCRSFFSKYSPLQHPSQTLHLGSCPINFLFISNIIPATWI
jgi:hypothetical protein